MPTADELLGAEVAAALVEVVQQAAPGRPLERLRTCPAALAPLGLRQRCDLLSDALLADLPGDGALDRVAAAALLDDRFTGWMVWPVSEAVTARALTVGGPDAFDDALARLAELTPRLTAELAIRPLLEADLARALPVVLAWTGSPDPHVRRLASEGTRPLLPWARRVRAILADPSCTVPVLDALHRDDDEVVRRSVANHLNDLSRHHPELAVATAARWLAAPDAEGRTERVVRHGMRTLLKRGDGAALALLGYGPAPTVVVTGPVLEATSVAVGDELAFRATVHNAGDAEVRLAIDYVVHHRKAHGRTSPKVFKLTTRTLAPGEVLDLARRHSFRLITTRRYHAGEHAIELQVNGTAWGRTSFELVPSPGGLSPAR